MRLLPTLLLALVFTACAPDEATPGGGGDGDGASCPAPTPPAGCPGDRITETIDLVTACPILVCGACPQVEAPPCEGGRLVAEMDEASGCPLAWGCVHCEEPPVPACPGATPIAQLDPATGCTVGWRCEACPTVDPAACDDAVEERDPVTGCLVGWRCEGCPEPEPPACPDGTLVYETDPETGCGSWSCAACPEPEMPACEAGAYETIDGATGCATWACCAAVAPATCDGAVEVEDPVTGCTTAWRCPGDTWASVEGLSGSALVDGLHQLVRGHRALSYDGARDRIFTSLDVVNGRIECIYTGRTTAPDGTRTPGDMNTEHSWPQSEGASTAPAKSDLHHLFPTDMNANSRRGSLPFGETDCARASCSWTGGGSEVGPSVSGGGTIFEVRPPYRGDIARAHFYFSVRYRLAIPAAEETVLRRWHVEDPPSAREADRNDGIEAIQQNRNPFVDRPEFVGRIADF